MLGIYTRLSREDDDSNSIKNQIREGKDFALKNHLSYEIYDEGMGVSGRDDIKNRPQLNKLLKDINRGEIKTVWMRNQNRLERNSLTFHVFATIAKKKKLKVVFGDKEMDWQDPSNFLLSSIMTSINAYQGELQADQTRKSLRGNVREGRVHGVIPYGYKSDENNLMQIDQDESNIVKRVYEMSLKGIGTNKIAELLNQEGIPTRYNKIGKGIITIKHKDTEKIKTIAKKDIKWSGNTIRGIIVNPIYKGVRMFSEIEYTCPNIFDDVYWGKVNKNLSNNRNNSGKKVEHKYLLKGLLRCGRCGRNYYGRVNKRDSFYMCSSKRIKSDNCGNRGLSIAVLEDLIWTKFIADGKLSKLVENHFNNEAKKGNLKALENDVKIKEKRLSGIKKDREKLIDLVLKEGFTTEQVKPRNRKLEIEEMDIKLELNNLKEQLKQYSDIENNITSILGELNNINNTQINHNDKREILKKHISNIVIHYDDEETYFIHIDFINITMDSIVYALPKHYKYAYTLEFGAEIKTEMILLEKLTGVRRESSTEYDITIMMDAQDVYEDLLLKYKNQG